MTAGAVTSGVAGAAAGLIDGLWSWGPASQFLPDAGGKLRLLAYLAAAYGLAAALAGTALTAVALFYLRATRLGDLWRHAIAEHRRIRAAEPRDALAGLALVWVGIPTTCLALALVYLGGVATLTGRKHLGLVIVVAIGATLAALALAALWTFAAGRLVELVLRWFTARRPRLARLLSCEHVVRRTALALLVAHAAAAVVLTWSTVRVLPWRGPAVGLIALALAAGFAPAGRRLATRLGRRGPGVLAGGGAGTALLLAIVMIVAGGRGAVIKAAVGFSGLGGPIAEVVRRAFDFDRDGYARFLGGGDCDDGDPSINPGARDIPDDGIDQNCAGGDATIRRSADDAAFAPVPAGLPADFNVVLITVDTLRADHLGMYGYGRDTSPALDALAAEATVFTNGWAHAPSTRYSMPAILTGRLPLDVYYDHGVSGWPGLLPRATTIAELLRARGLATGAILNYSYFDAFRRMDQGFDHYDNENKRLHQGADPAHTRGSSSKEQSDKAIAWVEEVAAGRFFLWVHYYDPHHEYERHAGVPSFGDERIDLYDHEIRWTDAQIGRLFDELRRRGLWDKTVIVITGDHGEGFGEHGVDLHGYHLYAAQTKVPLLIRIPGQPGRRATMPAGHVDVLPTLANLAGAAPSTEMMGRSLVDVLSGQADADADRVVFQQLSYEGHHEMRAAVSQRCHVIYNVSPHTSWEIYRLDTDPTERRDIVDAPGPCAEVRGALARWHDAAQIPAGAAEAVLSGKPDIARPLDVDFGAEVRLLAVELPAEVHAGDTFDVTWTFEARGRLGDGWKVFVHLEQPGGRGRFAGDHEPAWPFAWWKAGQYVRYTRSITVPRGTAAGTYDVWAGLWRGKLRRPARGDVEIVDDRAQVATLKVVP